MAASLPRSATRRYSRRRARSRRDRRMSRTRSASSAHSDRLADPLEPRDPLVLLLDDAEERDDRRALAYQRPVVPAEIERADVRVERATDDLSRPRERAHVPAFRSPAATACARFAAYIGDLSRWSRRTAQSCVRCRAESPPIDFE